jgi:protein-disulfide isomerase
LADNKETDKQKEQNEEQEVSSPEEDTITITKLQLWQGISGILAVALVLVVVLGTGLFTGSAAPAAPTQQQGGTPSGQAGTQGDVEASAGDDPVLGEEDAPVTIAKFTDFGCPFCQRWHDQTLPQIVSNYVDSGQVKIVYKDAPIVQLHPDAPAAHQAANCVYQEGGTETYYEYVDTLYSNQRGFTESNLVQWADDLGTSISSCLESADQSEIQEDRSEAEAAGLRGTPHFVVGDQTIRGAQPYSQFQSAIEAQLQG